MTDGSDERLAELGDVSQVGRPARAERIRHWLEEWKTRMTSPAALEPGTTHPNPDQPPPANEPHPEFDPTPRK